MSTTVGVREWARADARAEQARLALGTWMVLLAADVALDRPTVGEAELAELGAARVRVARLGGAVNDMAVRVNGGGEIAAAELGEVLDRLASRVEAGVAAVRSTGDVFAAGPPAGRRGGAVEPARGRRRREGGGRGRRIRAEVTVAERDLLVGTAAREGLSVGAWLGQLVEDSAAVRPLAGEVWRAVFDLRRALRRVATNLAQIEAGWPARRTGELAVLAAARRQVDAAIRACLDTQAAISAAMAAGGAR